MSYNIMFLYNWIYPSVNAREFLSRIKSGYSFTDLLNYSVIEWDSDDQVFDIIFKLADNNSHPLLKCISHALKNYLSKMNSKPENYLIDELKSENEMLKESMSDIIDQKLQNFTKMFESLNFTIKENFCMTNAIIAEDKTPQIIVQGHDSDTVKKLINKAVSEKDSTIFELQNEIRELKSKSLLENSSSKVATYDEIIEKQRKEIQELNHKLRELEKRLETYQSAIQTSSTSTTSSKKTKNPSNKETKTGKKKPDFSEYKPMREDSKKEPQNIPDRTEPLQSAKEKVIYPNLAVNSLDNSETLENPRTVVPDFEQILEVIKSTPNSVPLYKDYVDMFGNNLFIYAVWRQLAFDQKWLNKFINAGYDVNFRGNNGRTVLWWACEIGVRKTIEYLLNLPNIQYIADYDGVTPYRIAAANKRTGALRLLEVKGYRK